MCTSFWKEGGEDGNTRPGNGNIPSSVRGDRYRLGTALNPRGIRHGTNRNGEMALAMSQSTKRDDGSPNVLPSKMKYIINPSETTRRIPHNESNNSNINRTSIHRRLSFAERQEQLAVLLQQQIEATRRDISGKHDAVFRTAVFTGSSWHNQRRTVSRTRRFEGNRR